VGTRAWPVLEDLPQDLYDTILREADFGKFERGQAVFHRGDPARDLHLITRGHFAVEYTGTSGKTVVLTILGPGDPFGEVALVEPDATRSATVVALETARTRVISREWFTRLREQDPSLDKLLIAVLAAQVRRLSETTFEVRVAPRQRVRRRLCALARSYDDGVIPITTDVLADIAGTTRARVSEVIREEKAAGTIDSRRGRIAVLRLDALEDRARSES
jgi:CRP-like cAMP-binding protein